MRGWWLNTDVFGVARMFIGTGSSWQWTTAGPVLTPGERHHLVATYDGTRARLYVNGVLASTGPAATMAPNTTTTPMRIGQHVGAGQYWPGVIDDASFYAAALTASEVAAHYDASVNGSTVTSAATAVVGGAAPVAPSNTGLPVVSGTAQEGQTLTAAPGTWSGDAPISYAYQWRRCNSVGGACVDVGANASSFVLTGADVGSTLRVQVTGSNVAGSSTAVSDATAPVVGLSQPPVNQTAPTISGTAQVGQTLTASSGSWSGSPPISYAYQWRRCNSAGGACVDVGANASSFALTGADVGSTLRVQVTGSNVAGSSTAVSSATAQVVGSSQPPVNQTPPTISGTAQEGQTLTAAPGTWSGDAADQLCVSVAAL